MGNLRGGKVEQRNEGALPVVDDEAEKERRALAIFTEVTRENSASLLYVLAKEFETPVPARELVWLVLGTEDSPQAREKLRQRVLALRRRLNRGRVRFRVLNAEDGEAYKLVRGDSAKDIRYTVRKRDVAAILKRYDALKVKQPAIGWLAASQRLKVPRSTLRRYVLTRETEQSII